MSKKTTYEIITEKLEQVPLPDMRDAIWSRIEEQLDTDLPTDEGPSPDAPTSPDWVGLLTKFGLSAVVIGLVTFFLLKKPEPNQPVIPEKEETTVAEMAGRPAPDTLTQLPATPQTTNYGVKKKAPPNPENTPLLSLPLQDSVATEPVVVSSPLTIDSALQNRALVAEVSKPLKQDTVQKKTRGVKGIKDSDYRIVPQKDSIP